MQSQKTNDKFGDISATYIPDKELISLEKKCFTSDWELQPYSGKRNEK